MYEVASEVLFAPQMFDSEKPSKQLANQRITELAFAFNDFQLLNDCLYDNYNYCASYFDDSMDKTAKFLDFLSDADVKQTMVYTKSAPHIIASFGHHPSKAFKTLCADKVNGKRRVQFPCFNRMLNQAAKENGTIFSRLFDSKKKDERYQLEWKGLMRMKDFV